MMEGTFLQTWQISVPSVTRIAGSTSRPWRCQSSLAPSLAGCVFPVKTGHSEPVAKGEVEDHIGRCFDNQVLRHADIQRGPLREGQRAAHDKLDGVGTELDKIGVFVKRRVAVELKLQCEP